MDEQAVRHIALGAVIGVSSSLVTYTVWRYWKHRRKLHRKGLLNVSQQRPARPISPTPDSRTRLPSTTFLLTPHSAGPETSAMTSQWESGASETRMGESTVARESTVGESTVASAGIQSLLNLLFNMAEDQAHRDGYVHRGITCNSCNQSPLCGTRYKCANCNDYDICERCEPKDIHNRTHVFVKIKIPLPPLANPRTSFFKPLYPGREHDSSGLQWEDIKQYKAMTYLEQYEIEALYEEYKNLCGTEQGISREVYEQCLGPLAMEKNLLVDRIFKFYDRNNDNYIDFEELLTGVSVLVRGSPIEKLYYAFEGYDLDNKGYITKENLKRMFKAYFDVTIELVRDVVKACEEEMMANFDDNTGRPVSALFSAPVPNESSMPSMHRGKVPVPSNPGGRESMWPVMDAMSQDAIDEMAQHIFRIAKLHEGQKITYSKFREIAMVDSSLVAWFDALGTVF